MPTWISNVNYVGCVQVMTKTYGNGEHFPSSTFCVFSNRIFSLVAAAILVVWKHGCLSLAAPLTAFAPPAISNTISSFAQYEALNYVSFPLQTLSKSTKVIPVMLMGKLLNKKEYPWIEYAEAVVISLGVSMFALSKTSKASTSKETGFIGISLLALYLVADSFTSQYQSRVYKTYPTVDQFQMMFAVNSWAIMFTLSALLLSDELWITVAFLQRNPEAVFDNVTIAVTSATGQLFIFYTIREFGPIAFTIIMTTRQMFSMLISMAVFGHPVPSVAVLGAVVVFTTLFVRIKRKLDENRKKSFILDY